MRLLVAGILLLGLGAPVAAQQNPDPKADRAVKSETRAIQKLVGRWLKMRLQIECKACATAGSSECKKCLGKGGYTGRSMNTGRDVWHDCRHCSGAGRVPCRSCKAAGYNTRSLGAMTWDSLPKEVRGKRSRTEHLKRLIRAKRGGDNAFESDKVLLAYLAWAFTPAYSHEAIRVDLAEDLLSASVRCTVTTPAGEVDESYELRKVGSKWLLAPPEGYAPLD